MVIDIGSGTMRKLTKKQKITLKNFPTVEEIRSQQMKADYRLVREFLRITIEDYERDNSIEHLIDEVKVVIKALEDEQPTD